MDEDRAARLRREIIERRLSAARGRGDERDEPFRRPELLGAKGRFLVVAVAIALVAFYLL